MIYNFDALPNRRSSESLKWGAFPEDVLPMWIADMDFVSPEPVIRALHERVEHGIFGYPMETPELRQVIVDRMADLYRWSIQPEDIILVPGVVKGFNLACLSVASPGGGVLVMPPVYPPILQAPAKTETLRKEAPLVQRADGTYEIGWDEFEAAIHEHTRLFILCNPHNPVGRVFRRDELERMAEICLRQGVVICSDEIHCDLIYRGYHHIPIASMDPEIAQNTITLMAPSKTYNIPGLQCSYAIIPNPELRQKYQNATKGLVSWVNLMGMVAMSAAYRHGQEWLEQVLTYLEHNRDFVFGYLAKECPSIRMVKPEGTYLAWLDCRQSGIEGNCAQFFLEKGKVALEDGSKFGREGEGFVRLNFGCPRSMLAEALERMKHALQAIGTT